MKLKELLQKMYATEKVMIKTVGEFDFMETTPEEVINEYENLSERTVSVIWASHSVYKSIVIEVE